MQYEETRAKAKDQKGKSIEGAYPQSGLSASETPDEEGYGHAWESDDWCSSQRFDESWTSAAGWSCTKAQNCMDGV